MFVFKVYVSIYYLGVLYIIFKSRRQKKKVKKRDRERERESDGEGKGTEAIQKAESVMEDGSRTSHKPLLDAPLLDACFKV
jgi:hypothetical protein